MKRRLLESISQKLDVFLGNLEKAQFLQFIEYTQNRKRMFWNSVLLGIARGLGAAIGFSILGALLWYVLQEAARSSIPILGEFVSEIVKIVEKNA